MAITMFDGDDGQGFHADSMPAREAQGQTECPTRRRT